MYIHYLSIYEKTTKTADSGSKCSRGRRADSIVVKFSPVIEQTHALWVVWMIAPSCSLSLYFSLHSRLSGVTPWKMRADWCRRGNEWPLICMLIVWWPLGDCFGAGSMLRGTSEWHPITANTPTAMARMTVYVIMFWKSRPYLSNLAP